MKAEQLWASILQDAIQGKLVPQLDEEPEVEQIGDAPEDVPFEIPEKWKWINFIHLAKIVSGTSYKKTDEVDGGLGVRIIRGGNVKNFNVSFRSDDVFVREELRDLDKVILPGDIVIVASTGSKTVIGNPGICLNSDGAQIGAFLRIVRPISSEYVEFIRYFFQSNYYRNYISNQAKGTNINNIKKGYLERMAFPLPPLPEQHRIVARLNELKPLVEAYGKEQEQLELLEATMPEKLKASLLQEAIQGKLVPQLDEEPEVEQIGEVPAEVPFEIPEKWKWVSLNSVGKFISGFTPPGDTISSIDGVPYFKVSDMNTPGNEIFLKNVYSYTKKPRKTFPQGTIVYPKNGGAVFTNKRRRLAYESVVDLNTGGYIPSDKFDQEYIFAFFKSIDFRQMAKGTALPTIDQKKLQNLPVPLPPLPEQRRIVARLNELLPEIEKMNPQK